MKLLASPHLRGKKINLPDIGETNIPEDGIFEVEEYLGKILIDSKIGYTDFDKASLSENTELLDGETPDNVLNLSQLSLEELIELAEQSGLPKDEWEKLSQNKKNAKGLLVNYLSKKIK